jgi:acetyl-CoA synthetase
MNTQTLNWPIIRKSSPWPGDVAPNVLDYDALLSTFSWDSARAALDGLPAGARVNIAHEAVDRHATGAHANRAAFRWIARDGSITEATYAELAARTNRFANALRGLGVGKGDRVFTLLGRVPELYVTAMGTLKNTSVLSPLFSAFGPEPIRQRLVLGDARVLVTTPSFYRRRVAPIRAQVPTLEHVVLVGD